MAHSIKNDDVQRVENVEKGVPDSGSSSKSTHTQQEFDPKRAARVRHRIDWRLIPTLGAMYGISLMDRKNVSNAAVAGMLVDLKLVNGYGYNLANLCFFITYILFQPVTIVMCRRIGPRYFLPGVCLLWGAVIIGFGFAKNWVTLIPLRLILGLLESGYFPGCLLLLSCWYTKHEVGKRYSIFYLIGSMASALSGILAYGLQQMEGIQGIRGWRWIFIMEGVITCAVAVFSISFICKFPDEEKTKPSWRFLSTEDLDFAMARLNKERGDVELEEFTWKRFFAHSKEWYIYAFPLLLLCATTVSYGFAFTLPIILRNKLKFSVAMSQCMGAPPYAFAGFLMYASAWASDRFQSRGPVLIALCLVSLVGLPIMGFVSNPWGQYVGVFITVSGIQSVIPGIMAYQATNIRGQWRRAFCSASLTGIGGIGGISGALIFRSQDAPKYLPGFAACITACVLIMLIVVALTLYFRRCNRQADRGERVLLEDPSFRFTI